MADTVADRARAERLLPVKQARRRPRLRVRTLAMLGIGIGIAAAALGIARGSKPADARTLIADGAAALAAGDYTTARDRARSAAAAAPRSAAAHLVLARAYLLLDDGLAGEAALDRAVTAGASARGLHAWRAHARLLQGDVEGALAETAHAGAGNRYAMRIRARALAASDPAAATGLLAGLVARDAADGDAWSDLARVRLSAGDIGGAAEAIARAVRLARHDPATLTLAAEIVRIRFGLNAALPWFGAALTRDADYHPALIEQAATLGDLGRNAAMLAATRRALTARPGSPQALYMQAVMAARAGKADLARRLLQQTGGAIDGVPGVQLLRGTLAFRRGDYDQAAATWRQLVEGQPMNLAARRLLALALLRSGDPAGTIEVLRPIVTRGDADGYSLRLAARALERAGDRAAAATLLDRAARGAGQGTGFAADGAVGALAAAAAAAPGDPTRRIALIRGLIDSGAGAAAVNAARVLADASPGAPAAWLALGDALAAAGQRDAAAAAHARAADLAFDSPTMLRLVDSLGTAAQARRAAAVMSLYLAQNPQAVEGRRILGRWQVAAGDFDGAIVTLQALRRILGDRDVRLLADLALAHAGAGDGATARRYGRIAYTLAPASPDAVRAYAAALAAAGDAAGARQLAVKARLLGGSPGAR
jgi:tetratricopeptide (TPR) repeat protein